MSSTVASVISVNNTLPWNKGRLVGQKKPLKPRDVWAIRVRMQLAHKTRDLAMLNLAVDSKLRGCDLVAIRINDISNGHKVLSRASVLQSKTKRPVTFELTEQTRSALEAWITQERLDNDGYLFPSRINPASHISTRQYRRIVRTWVEMAGLDASGYGTHSLRRTKVTLIYRLTKNLRAVQLLLGHTKLESTIRYLGIEVADALEIAEQTEI